MLVAPRPRPRPCPLQFKASPIKVIAAAPAVQLGFRSTRELELKTDAIRGRLDSVNLGGMEVVLKVITDKLAEHGVKLNEHSVMLAELSVTLAEHSVTLAEHSVKLTEHSVMLAEHSVKLAELEGLKELVSTGSSPSILVYECMRLVACRVAKEYNHEYRKLGKADVEVWKRAFFKYSDKISFKAWERAFSKYSTKHTPCSNVSFEVAMSALYHCLARPRELNVNVEEYPFLCEKMVPMYRAAVDRYCEKLGEEKGEFVRKLLAPDSDAKLMQVLNEWNRLKSEREGRNNMGLVACLIDDSYSEAEPERHFASLYDCDYCKSELRRVEMVRKVLARYVECNSEYVERFTSICKAALVELGNSMEKRKAAADVAAGIYKLRAAANAEIWGPLFGE